MEHAYESEKREENDMSIHQMLRNCAKQIKKAGGDRTEVRHQAMMLGQFTVGLIACGEHPDVVVLLQKIVASMITKDSMPKRLVGRICKLPNEALADEAVQFHCHQLTMRIEAAAEGDVMDTLSTDTLRAQHELRIVVESIQAWLSIMVKVKWDFQMDFEQAMEEANEALSKLDATQKEAMSLRASASKTI
jgi:hypothetical protein